MDPLTYLPSHLRAAASKLPAGKQHTVLDLPPPGSGHNAGLLRVALICHQMDVSPEDTLAHLRDIYEDRGDHNTATMRVVDRVWTSKGNIESDSDGNPGEVSPEQREEMLNRFKRTTFAEITATSPVKAQDLQKLTPKEIIQSLFEADHIVNIQRSHKEQGTLLKVSDLPDNLDQFKFLNPSHFKQLSYTDQSGKTMTRCNANVKDRPFLLLECDFPPSDPDAVAKTERFNTFGMELAKFIPLVAITDTGGKSGHLLYDATQATPEQLKAIKKQAIIHFADKQMFIRSQIGRMPNVSSAGPGRGPQALIYFDPDHTKTPKDLKWDSVGFEKFLTQTARLENFYDSKSKSYYMQSDSGRWVAVNRQSLTVHLARMGFRPTRDPNEMTSPAEDVIADIERRKSVEAVMVGASGHHAGHYQENGISYLVLKSPKLIKPRKGDWSTIRKYLKGALRADPIQYPLFLGMNAADCRNFRNNGQRRSRHAPYQVAHNVGAGNAGKTIWKEHIWPKLLGGRSAKANPLFDPKGSDFNSEMHQAEALSADDASVFEGNHKFRHTSSEIIKEISVGGGMDYHGKFGDKLAIKPWWRYARFMNDEAETLATLPLLDDSVADKWILFKWLPMDEKLLAQQGWFEKWNAKVQAEIPAFLHYLLYEHVILPEHRDPTGRYAIRNYKNPEIMKRVQENATETSVLHKIDTSGMFDDFDNSEGTVWEGTTNDLYDYLSEMGSHVAQKRFTKTCPAPRVLATQLRLLETQHPDRFQYSGDENIFPKKKKGVFYWRIHPAPTVGTPTEEDCF